MLWLHFKSGHIFSVFTTVIDLDWPSSFPEKHTHSSVGLLDVPHSKHRNLFYCIDNLTGANVDSNLRVTAEPCELFHPPLCLSAIRRPIAAADGGGKAHWHDMRAPNEAAQMGAFVNGDVQTASAASCSTCVQPRLEWVETIKNVCCCCLKWRGDELSLTRKKIEGLPVITQPASLKITLTITGF